MDFFATGKEEERNDLMTNLKIALKAGEINLRVMELLDKGHRAKLGTPYPAEVNRTPVVGKVFLHLVSYPCLYP